MCRAGIYFTQHTNLKRSRSVHERNFSQQTLAFDFDSRVVCVSVEVGEQKVRRAKSSSTQNPFMKLNGASLAKSNSKSDANVENVRKCF